MFKITIAGIVADLLNDVEKVGKIKSIDPVRGTFTATFDGCAIKVNDCCIRIKNLVRGSRIDLARCEFVEVTIE